MHHFFTALKYYTRLPVPKGIDYSALTLNRATVYFPLIGWIIGGIGICTYWLGMVLFPPTFLPVLFSIVATVWATGALHEEGFAVVCDGFSQGSNKAQILSIMKDGRLSTFGSIGLGLLLSVKFFALQSMLSVEAFGPALVLKYLSAHSLSRLTATTVMRSLPFAQDDPNSDASVDKAQQTVQSITAGQLSVATLLGLMPLLALVAYTGLWIYLTFLIPLALVHWRLISFFRKWIGGYTVHSLGATQQLAEVIIYLSFVSLLWVSI